MVSLSDFLEDGYSVHSLMEDFNSLVRPRRTLHPIQKSHFQKNVRGHFSEAGVIFQPRNEKMVKRGFLPSDFFKATPFSDCAVYFACDKKLRFDMSICAN